MGIRYKKIIGFFVVFVLLPFKLLGFPHGRCMENTLAIAEKLGWVTASRSQTFCGGYYKALPLSHPSGLPQTKQENRYRLQADETTYSLKGTAEARGHVRVTREGRTLSADTAHVSFDQKAGKIKSVAVKGNVRFVEAGKLLLADRGHMHFLSNVLTLQNVFYRFVHGDALYTREKWHMTAWGGAKTAKRDASSVIHLEKATYTTCPPVKKTVWKLKADKIHLNPKSGRGKAIHTQLLLKDIPVFYFPYLNFPLSKKRQSGFLMPSYHFSSTVGSSLTIPYYWNIAPNYDMTFSPDFMTKRGVLFNGVFRYLTASNRGAIDASIVPFDLEFRQFQKEAKMKYVPSPALDKLEKSSHTRYAFSFIDHLSIDPHWKGDIVYHYVSDDYYLQDFNRRAIDKSNNQLFRQARINYLGAYWHFLANIQGYQTLYPVNQAEVDKQYAKMPQLQLTGHLPYYPFGLQGSMTGEIVRFLKDRDPYHTVSSVGASRLSVRPEIRRPFNWPYAYFTPGVQLQMTKYNVERGLDDLPKQSNSVIPIVDAKAGMYFDRQIEGVHHRYVQTLEPVIYYLYVPYRDQDQFPYFDTTSYFFDYDCMFRDNRFSGIDRIGDTHQVTIGFNTRFIDQATGKQKANGHIGVIRYFRKHKVNFCPNAYCMANITEDGLTSPVAASFQYYFNTQWNAHADVTVNTHRSGFDNQQIGIQYKPHRGHIVNVGYSFIHRDWTDETGANEKNEKNEKGDLKQVNISSYLKLNNRWSMVGRWNYNWSRHHTHTYLYGLAYESCCWAIRFMGARTYVGVSDTGRDQFDHAVYLQLALKGLGNIGNNDPKALLSESILGYTDYFARG